MRRFFVLSSFLIGCGSSSISFDSTDAGGGADTGTTDAGADAACTPGKTDSSTCGRCGTRVRVCGSDGKYSDWSTCSGEGVCTPGTRDSLACASGGSRSRLCSATCAWGDYGPCTTEPPCTPGKTESRACGKCGTQTRTCGPSGAWSDYGACGGEGECAAGSTESSACPDGSTKSRTCAATCTWGAFGACSAPPCVGGPPVQTFAATAGAGMWGCGGSVAWANASTLCGPGRHVCTADEFIARDGDTKPTAHFWVKDYLAGSGSESACKASKSTASNFCPSGAPMRVCGPSKYDGAGNYCTWISCGYESTTTDKVFGGCNDDSKGMGLKAGALCCD